MSIDSEWRFAMRQHDREREDLRELNTELLAALKLIPSYHYCLPGVVVKKAEIAISKAEKLK